MLICFTAAHHSIIIPICQIAILTWQKWRNMTEDILSTISNGKKFFDEIEADALADIEIDKGFERSLLEETITVEEVVKNAPWNQRENEGDLPYEAFKYFVNLDITDWEPISVLTFGTLEVDVKDVQWWSKEFEWRERRMAHLKYEEWLRRRQDEMQQLDNITNFRDNQADLLKSSSRAAVSLVEKLNQRIEFLEPEEIKVADIPKFVSSLATFLDMASDAEARYTTINELLSLYEGDIDAKMIQDHIENANTLKVKKEQKKTKKNGK